MAYCGCIPWDYIPTVQQTQSGTKICNFFGKSCFNSFLDNGFANTCKDTCTADCNEVEYAVSVDEKPLDWKKLCSHDQNVRNAKLELFELKALEHIQNITHLEKAGIVHFQQALMDTTNTSALRYKYCSEKMRFDVSIVDIIMDSPKATRYVQTLRVNLSDKLANLGKNSTL